MRELHGYAEEPRRAFSVRMFRDASNENPTPFTQLFASDLMMEELSLRIVFTVLASLIGSTARSFCLSLSRKGLGQRENFSEYERL